MISKNQTKFIQSLKLKKYRQKNSAFVVEGEKMVKELLMIYRQATSFVVEQIDAVYATKEWLAEEVALVNSCHDVLFEEVTKGELAKISQLKTPNKVVAVVRYLHSKNITPLVAPLQEHILVLDHIQDPGNLGTIIRIADWFGIKRLYCSTDCVDLFNAKVIQATMGSVFRIAPIYTNLELLLSQAQLQGIPVYGAMLGGEPIKKSVFKEYGLVVIGNEGGGIRTSLQTYLSHKITIPRLGEAESLNAAIATGIIYAIINL